MVKASVSPSGLRTVSMESTKVVSTKVLVEGKEKINQKYRFQLETFDLI